MKKIEIKSCDMRLHPHMSENIQIIIDTRFQGMKAYCIKRNIDLAVYWQAFKYGSFPHSLIAQFLQDKILNQSGNYFYLNYEDLIDCAHHRLLKSTTPERFQAFYSVEESDYLKFFKKYIFNGYIYTNLITAEYWKDEVACLYNIPSEQLENPTDPKENLTQVSSDLRRKLTDKKALTKRLQTLEEKRKNPPKKPKVQPKKYNPPDLEEMKTKSKYKNFEASKGRHGDAYAKLKLYILSKYPTLTACAASFDINYPALSKHITGMKFHFKTSQVFKHDMKVPSELLYEFYMDVYPEKLHTKWWDLIT